VPRTTAVTLGFVLVAAVSLGAQQSAPLVVGPRENAAFVVFTVKADKATEFEAAWAAIRAGLARMSSSDARAFGASLKLYRDNSNQPIAFQSTVDYLLPADGLPAAYSYNPQRLINDTLLPAGLITRDEADDILRKLNESFTRIQVRPMVKIG